MTSASETIQLPRLLLTTAEAARVLAVSERTLWSLAQRGEIPTVHPTARAVRFDVRDLQAWIDSRKTGHK
jgi:excisionase family DNA binding protein